METATAVRKAARQPARAPDDDRVEAREPVRALRPGEVIGRNGEVLSRSTSMGSDPFEIPSDVAHEIEQDGYALQWCRQFTAGQEDRSNITRQMAAGWRPVEATRFAGRFMPPEHKGNIENGGLVLCERPKQFNEQARKEMQAAARMQKRMQGEQFGMKYAPDGFDAKRGEIKRAIEGVSPELTPRHQLLVDD